MIGKKSAAGALFAARLLLCACALLAALPLPAHGEGVTLRTVSTFTGIDAAAETYVNLLKSWEEATGNKVEDSSSSGAEVFKAGVLNDFAAGNEADVLFFFSCTSDSLPILGKVVPIGEINAAYPGVNLPEDPLLRERDGKVYAISTRPYWEGLFCNTDLFAQVGAELPTDWVKLEEAVRKFKAAGITPISASFSDIPHYIADAAILSASSPEEYTASPGSMAELPESWIRGTELIARLYAMGAFPADVNATSEAVTSQRFRDKEAAMQVDGSWFANGIPEANWDSTVVIPFPTTGERADPLAFLGGASMGFYVSRKAWNDPGKRDAAVDLLAHLTTGENAAALSDFAFGGELYASSLRMIEAGEGHKFKPIQDRMDPQARSIWFSMIPSVADGTVSAREAWEKVMEANPFP